MKFHKLNLFNMIFQLKLIKIHHLIEGLHYIISTKFMLIKKIIQIGNVYFKN